MKAIIDAAGKIVRVTPDTDGSDLDGCTVVDLPQGFDPVLPSHDFIAGHWVPNVEAAMARLRSERDARLSACDWTQLVDVPSAIRDAWQPYRQALRDMPERADPFAPIWPNPPQQEYEE